MFVLTTHIQHCTESPSQNSKARKINKTHTYWEGRNQTLHSQRTRFSMQKSIKNLLGPISEFKQGCWVQKSIVFLYQQ